MSHDLVRRDEIWIADKNTDTSTQLFSLENEQVRIDKVLDQNYMNNVWGEFLYLKIMINNTQLFNSFQKN